MEATDTKQNEPTKSDYGSLSNVDKIRAILGAAGKPVSKELAIDLSQIDYKKLDNEAKAKIDAVFSEQDVEKSEVDNIERFELGKEGKEKLAKVVDMESVQRVITNNMLDELGMGSL